MKYCKAHLDSWKMRYINIYFIIIIIIFIFTFFLISNELLNPRWNYFLTSCNLVPLQISALTPCLLLILLEETTDQEYHESKMSWISGNDYICRFVTFSLRTQATN